MLFIMTCLHKMYSFDQILNFHIIFFTINHICFIQFGKSHQKYTFNTIVITKSGLSAFRAPPMPHSHIGEDRLPSSEAIELS